MSRTSDVVLFLVLSVLWGLTFPAISVGLIYLPPLLFAAVRYDVAAALLLAYAVVRSDDWMPRGRNNLIAIGGAGVFLVAGNGLLFIGQQTVPSGVAAIIQALVPIATALWALVLLGERLPASGAVGVIVGFVGIGFIVQPDPGNLVAGDSLGRLIIVCQVISIALGGVLIQRASPTLDLVPMTGWSMVLGAVILHVFSLGLGEIPSGDALVPTAVGAILYLGIFSTAVAFFLYFTILEEHGAFQAALVAYLVPIVATVVGVVVLDESIGVLSIIGFGLVAVGFAMLKHRAILRIAGVTTGIGRP